jgi:hypothetical protein
MAEELPSLHIDTDWKKQAQEEKRRLAEKAQQEQAAKPQAAAAAAPAVAAGPGAPTGVRSAARGARGQRELPPASIATLAQSLMTQAIYYLSDIAHQGGDPAKGLDMAKHNIDTLAVLDEKTTGNLTPEEREALDVALHQASSQFVSVASQFV